MAEVIFTGPTPAQPPNRPGTGLGPGLSAIGGALAERQEKQRQALISGALVNARGGQGNPFQGLSQAQTPGPHGTGQENFEALSPKDKFFAFLQQSGVQLDQPIIELADKAFPAPTIQEGPDPERGLISTDATGKTAVVSGFEPKEAELSREDEAALEASKLLGPEASDGAIRKAAQLLIGGGGGGRSVGVSLLEGLADAKPTETQKEIDRLVARGFTLADASDIARGRVQMVQQPGTGKTQLLNTVTGESRDTDVDFPTLVAPAAAGAPPSADAATETGGAMTGFEAVKFASASGIVQDMIGRVAGKGGILDLVDVLDVVPNASPEATNAITALADLRLAVLAAYRIPDARVKMTFEAVDDLVPKAGLLRSETASLKKMTSLYDRVIRDRGLAAAAANNPSGSKKSRLGAAEQVRQLDRLLLIIGNPDQAVAPPVAPTATQLSPAGQDILQTYTRGLELDAEALATIQAFSIAERDLLIQLFEAVNAAEAQE